jgi:NAD(P)-dependent dehydrogenase (short-subunit alcohol dehydrogenase family)
MRLEWEAFLRVNLYGVLHCTRVVLPGMIERGHGRITANNISLGTRICHFRALPRVSGPMRTDATEQLWVDPSAAEYAKAILHNYAIRRPGRPQDCALLAAVFASDHGAWITGQTIAVNGGFSFAL